MKSLFLFLHLLLPLPLWATGQQVRFALTMHSETTGGGGTSGIPFTPNFTSVSTSTLTYVQWREALIHFAKQCQARNLPWQFQSDYNFLEGVRRFEVRGGLTGAQIMNGTYSNAALSAYTYGGVTTSTNTGGKNVLKYLHETLGVNLDPHSHETNPAYNYADVAWLIDVGCDTDVTQVVGGHVCDPTSSKYQNWPKFISGLRPPPYRERKSVSMDSPPAHGRRRGYPPGRSPCLGFMETLGREQLFHPWRNPRRGGELGAGPVRDGSSLADA